MKTLLKTALTSGAACAAAMTFAAPAAAQVNGIATSSPEAVMVRSKARIAAYQQIEQTYAQQISQIQSVRQEVATLQQSLDTNNDRQISQQELQANQGVVQQVQQKEQQLQTLSIPVVTAQYYAIEQLINDYNNAQNQVIQAKNIQLMLTPDVFQYVPEGADVTDDILAALDQRMPTVSITPPAGYQPRRETAATHQAVQQIISAAVQRRAAQQGAQQPAAPATQPTGR